MASTTRSTLRTEVTIMTDFPAHYSETAIAVLSLPGWTDNFNDSPDWGDDWRHENGTQANVDTDGTISTYPTVTYDDGMTDYWSPNSPHYAFNADDYMTADPIFRD
jgi:hypothetical protein